MLLTDQSLLHWPSDLQTLRRDGRLLLIRPTTAAWAVLEPHEVRLLRELSRPQPLWSVLARTTVQGMNPREVRQTAQRLHQRGVLSANGQVCPQTAPCLRSPQAAAMISVQLVEGCSPSCPDCAHLRRCMQPSTVLRIMQWVAREAARRPLVLSISGSEPLLAWPLLRDLLEGGLGRGTAAVVVHTTADEALLDDEKASFLAHHGVTLAVSTLAPVRAQPLLRACSMGLDVAPMVRIHQPGQYLASFESLFEMGFRSFQLHHIDGRGLADDFLQMVRRADDLSRRHETPLHVADLSQMIRNAATRQRDGVCAPCRLGDEVMVFDVAGNAYACCPNHSQDPQELCLGAVSTLPTWPELRRTCTRLAALQLRDVQAVPHCSRCAFQKMCYGGCTQRALHEHGQLFREDPDCRFYQIVYEELLWMLARDPSLADRLGGAN